MYKSNQPHTDEKLNEIIEHFAMLNQHEHQSNVQTEGEDISQKTVQQPQHANTDQPEEMKQNGGYQKNKQEPKS